MDLLFIIDPLPTLKPHKDSSIAMMRAAQARGHQVFVAEASALFAADGAVQAHLTALRLFAGHQDWYQEEGRFIRPLTAFAGIVMRKDPPFDSEYLYATHLLSAAERAGARVFNRASALRDHNEKLAILEFASWIAPTLVSSQPAQLLAFLAEHGDIILKPLDGMGGMGIFRLRPDDPNLGVILETQTAGGQRTLMAQRYLPAISAGDKRILLINGEPVEWCLARIPKAGETRGNLAAGGTGIAQPLSPRDRDIASDLGPRLAARGLLLVGLDVIGEHLTEINVTSPTCFVEISAQSGIDVAGMFIHALEQQCTG
jgi:glutathione synthase